MGVLIIGVGIAVSLFFYFISEGSLFKNYGITHAVLTFLFTLYAIFTIRKFKVLFAELFGPYKSEKISETQANKYLEALNLKGKKLDFPLENALLISNAINYVFPFSSHYLGQVGIMFWLTGFLNCILFAIQGQLILLALGILYFVLLSVNSGYLPGMRLNNAVQYLQTSNIFKFELESLYSSPFDGNLEISKLQTDLMKAIASLDDKRLSR